MTETDFEVLLAATCPLCTEIKGSLDSLSSILGCNANHTILRNEDFAFIHDISPVIAGHSLLITNNHYNSFGQIHSSLNQIFLDFKKRIDNYFLNKYKRYFLFEHGTSVTGAQCNNCVSHAHIHYIPYSISIDKYLRPFSDQLVKGRSTDTLSILQHIKCEYFYYEDYLHNYVYVDCPKQPVPRQFLRMIMANELGLSDWNWRTVLLDHVSQR